YPAGTWSDDTSMTLCALESMSKGRIDYVEIMDNFCRWFDEGHFTPAGECFDIGGACMSAIEKYKRFHLPPHMCGGDDERSNGNGSLMRILPFALFCEYGEYNGNWLDIIHFASSLTHRHDRARIGCGIYSMIVRKLLCRPEKESVHVALKRAEKEYEHNPELEKYKRLFEPDFASLPKDDIKSSGYVVDTLEAAVWCLLTTDNYRDCVLKAVNLGDDTDTVAAVAGGLAGALYGFDSIPEEWLDAMVKRDYIESICEKFCTAFVTEHPEV
ncbi:MAG: ADP-ribosylglycohydrolase family protein, partial [Clostridia bacterium]|nr:ADP-ribosylglycohydrolase family protein [Clostridia bacterium]